MPEIGSEPDQLTLKLGLISFCGNAATLLVGGVVSTSVLACANVGVGCTLPALSVATL